jgi:hypothetical protein
VALFNILVDIAAKTASFESGMQRVEKRLDSFSAGAQRVASRAGTLLGVALGFEAIRSSVADKIAKGDELDRLASKLSTTAENLSQLDYIAKQSDIGFDSLVSSLDTFTKNTGMAAVGTGKAQRALKDLNINAAELIKLPLDQQLDVIADRLVGIENPTRRATIAMQLFGSSDVLSALQNGSAGLRKLREESDAVGYTISSLDASKLAAADAAIKALNSSLTALGNTAAVKVVPYITELANAIRTLAGGATQVEKLKDQLQFLERTADQPFMLNLGFIDGAGTILTSDEMNAKIAQLRRQIDGLTGGSKSNSPPRRTRSPSSAVAADTVEPVFARQINYYDSLWQELQKNYSYLELLEEHRNEQIASTVANRKALESSLERGIDKGVAETAKDAAGEVDALNDVMLYTWENSIKKQEEMSAFADQAARNMQDAFASFLFDPFEDGLKGMAKGFIDTIRQMLANAAAAQLFETLFGKGKDGGGGAGNWLGALIGAFGGGKAAGGPIESGKWYVAGEHGPEPIWGGGSGAFATGYGGGGGGSVIVNMPVDMRGASADAVQLLIAEKPRLIRQAADLAKAELRSDKRRGRF